MNTINTINTNTSQINYENQYASTNPNNTPNHQLMNKFSFFNNFQTTNIEIQKHINIEI